MTPEDKGRRTRSAGRSRTQTILSRIGILRHFCLVPLAVAASVAQGQTTGRLVTVPAGTLVMLRMEDSVSSQTSEAGETFRFVVDEDVMVGTSLAIPAGTPGHGEVIHVQPAHRDRAGEIVVVARSLRVGDLEVPLRTFVGGTANRDNDALAVQVAVRESHDLARPMVLGQRGLASARIAQTVQLPAVREVDAADGPPAVVTDQVPASAEVATIYFFRPSSSAGSLGAFKVREGKTKLGKLPIGTYFKIAARPGRHSYRAGSADDDLTLEVTAGENYYVICGVDWRSVVGRPNLAPSNKATFDAMRRQGRLRAVEPQ